MEYAGKNRVFVISVGEDFLEESYWYLAASAGAALDAFAEDEDLDFSIQEALGVRECAADEEIHVYFASGEVPPELVAVADEAGDEDAMWVVRYPAGWWASEHDKRDGVAEMLGTTRGE
jgi:hypothetical protein